MQSRAKLRKRDPKDKPKKIKEEIKSSGESQKEDEVKSEKINIDYKRIIIRCIVIVTIITIVNYTQGNKVETFASAKEEVKVKQNTFECSSEFLRSVKKFKGCQPKKCGRFVTDTHISLSEAQALAIIAQKVFGQIGPKGMDNEYSTFELYSGTLTKGNSAINVYKSDKTHKLVTAEDLKIYRHITDKIKTSIVDQFELTSESVYMAQPTFFTLIDPRYSDTFHLDEYWSPRVDQEKFSTFCYTAQLFLTDYDYHFKGGRLFFVDQHANQTVEPKVGRLTAFTSGSENVNFIEHVTSGTRLSVTIPFTCDPKKNIKDIKFPN